MNRKERRRQPRANINIVRTVGYESIPLTDQLDEWQEEDLGRYKLVVVGDESVGKTIFTTLKMESVGLSKPQFKSLVATFGGMDLALRLLNGMDAGGHQGLTEPNRIVALRLVNLFARWLDHSRIGVLEVQDKQANWTATGIPWEQWEKLFRAWGFGVFGTDLEDGMDFALNVRAGPGRPPKFRPMDPGERAALDEMIKQQSKLGDALAVHNQEAPDAKDPSSE